MSKAGITSETINRNDASTGNLTAAMNDESGLNASGIFGDAIHVVMTDDSTEDLRHGPSSTMSPGR